MTWLIFFQVNEVGLTVNSSTENLSIMKKLFTGEKEGFFKLLLFQTFSDSKTI